MTITKFFLKHDTLYAAARKTGAYGLYNTFLPLNSKDKPGQGAAYEPGTTKYVTDTLKPGDAFIDGGANSGYFSRLAAGLVKDGKVFAFEPVKSTFKMLEGNTLQCPNVQLINKAIGNSSGRAVINVASDGDMGTSSLIKIPNTTMEEIVITSLDSEFPEGIPNLKIIKLDIEGMEKEAIEGGRALIEKHKPGIIFEFNYDLLYRKNGRYDEVFVLLRKMGYNRFIELETGLQVESHRDLSNSSENVLAVQ